MNMAKHPKGTRIADSARGGMEKKMAKEIRKGWAACDHSWHEVESQFSSEYATDVRCEKCGCPGEKDNKTGDVFWPAT